MTGVQAGGQSGGDCSHAGDIPESEVTDQILSMERQPGQRSLTHELWGEEREAGFSSFGLNNGRKVVSSVRCRKPF